MTVRGSSPAARTRASSAERVCGRMRNWSAARTSCAEKSSAAVGELLAEQSFVRTKMQRRPQFQRQSVRTFEQAIDDVGGVLKVRHHHALLDADAALGEAPDGEAALEHELFHQVGLGEAERDAGLVAAQFPAEAVRSLEDLLEV